MTQAILASFPVESRFVPGCLESIIDAKVQGKALNVLQRLVDWICSWLYCPYKNLYRAKMERVHPLADKEVKLYDLTKHGVGGVESDFVTIQGRRIFFNDNPLIGTVFSRRAFTDFLVLKDGGRPGWFQIIEQEVARPSNPRPMEKSWFVNANHFGSVAGQTGVYLVEQPSAASTPTRPSASRSTSR
jgi:hypothetical protein